MRTIYLSIIILFNIVCHAQSCDIFLKELCYGNGNTDTIKLATLPEYKFITTNKVAKQLLSLVDSISSRARKTIIILGIGTDNKCSGMKIVIDGDAMSYDAYQQISDLCIGIIKTNKSNRYVLLYGNRDFFNDYITKEKSQYTIKIIKYRLPDDIYLSTFCDFPYYVGYIRDDVIIPVKKHGF